MNNGHVYRCGCGAELQRPPTKRHLESGAHLAWESRTAASKKGHTWTVSTSRGYLTSFRALSKLWPHFISVVYNYERGYKHRRASEHETVQVGTPNARDVLHKLKGDKTMALQYQPHYADIRERTLRQALTLNEIYGDRCAEIVVGSLLSGDEDAISNVFYANGLISSTGRESVLAELVYLGGFLLEAIMLQNLGGFPCGRVTS